jgi:hypothetical protein
MGLITFIQNMWWNRNEFSTGLYKWKENDGTVFWYSGTNMYHRDDGPAIEYKDGRTQYWINGVHIPQLDNKHIYGKDKLAKCLLLI